MEIRANLRLGAFARSGCQLYHQSVRDKVLHYIREQCLLRPGDRVAVAVSGGADSVALLRVLLELRAELGIVLAVAHFNHQLRGDDSDADQQFVAELAQQHDLPFFAGRADVREYSRTHKLSLEHAARNLRYQWLNKLAEDQRFDAIATAHTSDDQAETVLMKFLRGAGTRGLAAIHPIVQRDGVRIVRPMLTTSRADVEQFLSSLSQPWREDHTNRDTRITRNRIRHELLPLLERDYNPNLRQLLSETAEIARDEELYWQQHTAELVDHWHREERRMILKEETCFSSTGFLFASPAEQRRALKCFFERHGIATDFDHVEKVRLCALGDPSVVNLPGGWKARHQGDWLELCPPPSVPDDPAIGYEYVLPIPGRCAIPRAGITVRATIVPSAAAALEPPGTLLRVNSLPDKLTLRNWHAGDRFRPAHTGSEEKLKRLFSEKHIPADQRPLWPVVLSGSKIVWVRGLPPAHDFVWTPGSGDALRIELLPND